MSDSGSGRVTSSPINVDPISSPQESAASSMPSPSLIQNISEGQETGPSPVPPSPSLSPSYLSFLNPETPTPSAASNLLESANELQAVSMDEELLTVPNDPESDSDEELIQLFQNPDSAESSPGPSTPAPTFVSLPQANIEEAPVLPAPAPAPAPTQVLPTLLARQAQLQTQITAARNESANIRANAMFECQQNLDRYTSAVKQLTEEVKISTSAALAFKSHMLDIVKEKEHLEQKKATVLQNQMDELAKRVLALRKELAEVKTKIQCEQTTAADSIVPAPEEEKPQASKASSSSALTEQEQITQELEAKEAEKAALITQHNAQQTALEEGPKKAYDEEKAAWKVRWDKISFWQRATCFVFRNRLYKERRAHKERLKTLNDALLKEKKDASETLKKIQNAEREIERLNKKQAKLNREARPSLWQRFIGLFSKQRQPQTEDRQRLLVEEELPDTSTASPLAQEKGDDIALIPISEAVPSTSVAQVSVPVSPSPISVAALITPAPIVPLTEQQQKLQQQLNDLYEKYISALLQKMAFTEQLAYKENTTSLLTETSLVELKMDKLQTEILELEKKFEEATVE